MNVIAEMEDSIAYYRLVERDRRHYMQSIPKVDEEGVDCNNAWVDVDVISADKDAKVYLAAIFSAMEQQYLYMLSVAEQFEMTL